jgi:hypothetical protein
MFERNTMNPADEEESSVTVHELYKQLVETLGLSVRKIPVFDSGEVVGKMFEGFDSLPTEKQLVLFRRASHGPYVAPEIRAWMHGNEISPQKITSLVQGQGVFIEDDRDRCPLIDFDHWADMNEKLRRQGAILPCDVETGNYRPDAITTPYYPQNDDSPDDVDESRHGHVGLLVTCAELVKAGWANFGNYFFAGRPRRM